MNPTTLRGPGRDFSPGEATSIIAIDPGTTESAVVEWDGKRLIRAFISPNDQLTNTLRGAFGAQQPYPAMAIEMCACYGMAVGKEVFETCVWIGVFKEAYQRSLGVIPSLVFRQAVKLHLCQSARAKDANIRQALIDRFGAPGTKKAPGLTYGLKSHLWAAFALAVYAFDTQAEKLIPMTQTNEIERGRG